MDETELGATLLGDRDATGRTSAVAPEMLGKGSALGRYVVLGVLGSGGMGVVYSAYDPELDRRVAIKLLRPAPGRSLASSQGRARLVREAQSLARLSHPNVVVVHDVGEHDGQVFVAMEHVDGMTFGEWCQARRPSTAEILDVMTAAGRGLQAAHDKGMVHRDFKPDNVMLETHGDGPPQRVLVMDFGLAAPSEERTSAHEALPAHASTGSLSSSEILVDLTRTGAIMGTPAYMAPEQHAGTATDARTDQFAYCVTLYEALYGRRPFAGTSLPALVAATAAGRIEPAPPKSGVPRWLREVVVRGLQTRPEDRWPSMAALLEALAADPTRRRRRLAIAAAGLAAIGVAWGVATLQERRRLDDCREAADAIHTVYDDDARRRIEAAFEATELPHAAAAWSRWSEGFEARVGAWAELRYEACATPSAIPPELRAVADECFDAYRDDLAQTVALMEEADAAVVNRAIGSSLRSRVDRCRDPEYLRRRPRLPDDPDARQALVALDRRMVRSALLRQAGRYEEALDVAEACVAEATAIDDPRRRANALVQRAGSLESLGRSEPAAEDFEEAFFAARAIGDDAIAGIAARSLVGVVGYNLADASGGRRWARHAEILVRADGGDAVELAAVEHGKGMVELRASKFAAARQHFEAALEVFTRELGPHSGRAIETMKALASAEDSLGDSEVAIAHLREVLAHSEEAYGPEHPQVASAHNDLAAALLVAHRDEAETHLRRAIELFEGAGLVPSLGAPLDNLALVLRETGRPDEALKVSMRSLQTRRDTLPADHPSIADALINHGQILEEIGDIEAATADYEAALAMYERTLGPEHTRVGDAAYTLGVIAMRRGRAAEALPLHRRALQVRLAAFSADHPNVAWSALGVAMSGFEAQDHEATLELVVPIVDTIVAGDGLPRGHGGALLSLVAEALMARERFAEAVPLAERGLERVDEPGAQPINVAGAELALARARWGADEDRPAAIALAKSALARVRAASSPDASADERAEAAALEARLVAWLDERDAR